MAALAAALVGHSTRAAVAQEDTGTTLEAAMKELSTSVVRYLKTKEESGVIIGDFKGPDGNHSGMRKRLMDRIKDSGVEIKTKKGLRLDGNFSQEESSGTIDISLTMNDRNNKPVIAFNSLGIQAKVTDVEDIAATTGATVATPPNPADAQKVVAEAIQKPSFATTNPDGSIVSVNKSTPYRIEVLVRPAGSKPESPYAPRPVTNEEGQAFCPVRVGEEYAVKIYNDSEYDCAVKLSIDGLNCFEFSKVDPYRAQGIWIVPAKTPLLVRGWHITNQISESFLVVGLKDSAVGQLGKDTSTVGIINACFFAAWEGPTPPPIEPLGAKSGAGTGRGAPQNENFREVVRNVGKTMQASITVRYDKPDPDDLPPAE